MYTDNRKSYKGQPKKRIKLSDTIRDIVLDPQKIASIEDIKEFNTPGFLKLEKDIKDQRFKIHFIAVKILFIPKNHVEEKNRLLRR